MKNFEEIFLKFTSLSAFATITLLLSSQSALAGIPVPIGNVGFSLPGDVDPTAVPSLSGTMLIILSLLLFIVAFRISKLNNSQPSKFFISLIGVIALSFSIGGVKIINDVNAGGAVLIGLQTTTLEVDPNQTTGKVDVFPGSNFYDNPFGVDVTITSVNIIDNRYSCAAIDVAARLSADEMAPKCSEIIGDDGNIIPNDKQCQLNCRLIIESIPPVDLN